MHESGSKHNCAAIPGLRLACPCRTIYEIRLDFGLLFQVTTMVVLLKHPGHPHRPRRVRHFLSLHYHSTFRTPNWVTVSLATWCTHNASHSQQSNQNKGEAR